jgi:hypothetical protein
MERRLWSFIAKRWRNIAYRKYPTRRLVTELGLIRLVSLMPGIPDARAASIQESGLQENCTSRLSERTEAGRKLHLLRLCSYEAGEQRGAIRGGGGGAKGGDQGKAGQQSTYRAQDRESVSQALGRIRQVARPRSLSVAASQRSGADRGAGTRVPLLDSCR